MPSDLYRPHSLGAELWEQLLPHYFKGSPWGWGKGSLLHGDICFALMPKHGVPGRETSSQRAMIWLLLPSSAQTGSGKGIELRSQSSGGGVHVVLAQTVVFSPLLPATQLGLVPITSCWVIP